MPFITVITINFNNAAGLEKTIGSVLTQVNSDYEYIIIDGKSSDLSSEIIKNNESGINYWVSERDNGIYDAQNKGLKQAKGEYIIFLNSGDCFYNENVLAEFTTKYSVSGKKIYYGNTNLVNSDNTTSLLFPPKSPDIDFWYANTLNHQAVFTHKSIFADYGKFSTHLKYTSDFELFLKVFVKEPSEFQYMDMIVCNYDNAGLTSHDHIHKFILEERKKVLIENLSKKEYKRIRSVYLKSLPLKNRYTIIIRENRKLRTVLKPFYRFYTFLKKK